MSAIITAITALDRDILFFVQENLRSAPLDFLMKIITTLGNAGLLWIAACVLLMAFQKYRAEGIACSAALIFEVILVNGILKNLFMRIRPYDAFSELTILISVPHDFSFPSGHAGSSFAVAVVILLLLPRRLGISAIIAATLISLSRIYVGVHYPTDILAGALTGTLCAVVSVYILKKIPLFDSLNKKSEEDSLSHTSD